MTTTEYLEQFKIEIAALNTAYAKEQSAKTAWLDYRAELDAADLADDNKIETLANTMGETENKFDALELSLRVKSEKIIGRGKPLGDFWTAIREMQS